MSDTVNDVEKKSGGLNNKSSVGAKILMFLSGVALVLLLLMIFVQVTPAYLVFSSIVGIITVVLLLWLICKKRVYEKLTVSASKGVTWISLGFSIIFSAILTVLSSLSLIYAVDALSSARGSVIIKMASSISDMLGNLISSVLNQNVIFCSICSIILGVLSLWIVYLIVKKLIVSRYYGTILKSEKSGSVLLYGVASALWVFVPLFPLYLTNINNVIPLFIVLLSIIYIVGTIFLYLISLLISKSAFTSFCVCLLTWIGLSVSYSIINEVFTGELIWTILFTLLLLAVVIAAGYGINRLISKFEINTSKLSKVVVVFVVILVLLTLVPVVITAVSNQGASEISDTNKSFVVDTALPHPNIYWIHAESMVDTSVLEKYWGEDTVGFSDLLVSDGFIVNHDAHISGPPHTTVMLPSLFSPSYFDANQEFYPTDWMYTQVRPIQSLARNTMKDNHEFISAFDNAGYQTNSVISPADLQYIISPSQKIYNYNNGWKDYISVSKDVNSITPLEEVCYYDLDQEKGFIGYSAYPVHVFLTTIHVYDNCQKFTMEQLPSIDPNYVSEERKAEIFSGTDWLKTSGYSNFISAASYSMDNTESPSLTLLYAEFVHEGYTLDENGNKITEAPEHRLDGYYEQYLFSEKLVLYLVDTILESDPNAVIIIQGDHGPHTNSIENEAPPFSEFTEKFGVDMNPAEIWNHVLSAIRIPPQYQTEGYEEILKNPRNIVRYLINNYVGQNYEYLPTENYA